MLAVLGIVIHPASDLWIQLFRKPFQCHINVCNVYNYKQFLFALTVSLLFLYLINKGKFNVCPDIPDSVLGLQKLSNLRQ